MAAAVPGLSQEDRRSVRAAVLGSPISHSLSPVLHNAAYAALGLTWWRYEAIECDEAGLPALLDRCGPDWAGLSLTMPLKRSVLPLLDRSEPLVTEVGGANTVIFAAAQRLGYNTDVPGMVRALAEHGIGRTSTESVGPAEPPPPARPDPRCQALPGGSSPARPDPRSPASPASTPGGGPVLILGGGATACAALAALRELGERSAAVAVRDPARASDLRSAADRLGIAITLRPFEPAGARGARLIISTVPAWRCRCSRAALPRAGQRSARGARRGLPPMADPAGSRGQAGRCHRGQRLRPAAASGRRPGGADDRPGRPRSMRCAGPAWPAFVPR